MRLVRLGLAALLVMVVAWCLGPMPTEAKIGEFTGEDYLRRCTTPDPNWKPRNRDEQDDAVFCIGYLEGAMTLIVAMDSRFYCFPKEATPQEVLKATFSFMQAHPEQKQYLFGGVMLTAILVQYPCQK
jgi:hypothetical protein